MTDDIVARLRSMAAIGWNPIGDEAADEIERLRAEIARKDAALHKISLASQNSMSSREECGRIARAALAPAQEKDK